MQVVDVLVPAYNEELVIGETIQSIAHQRLKPGIKLQVWIVPNRCTDNTEQVAKTSIESLVCHRDITFAILKSPVAGKSKSINFALSRTKAPLVLCVDADVTFSQDCFTQIIECFNDPNVQVSGAQPYYTQLDALQRSLLVDFYRTRQLLGAVVGGRVIPTGSLLAFRRAAVEGFPENFVAAHHMWLSYDVARRFGTDSVTVAKDAKLYAIPPRDWLDFMSQESRWELNCDRLLQIFPELAETAAKFDQLAKKDHKLTPSLRAELVALMAKEGIDADALALVEEMPFILHDNSVIMAPELATKDGTWEPVASTHTRPQPR